MIKKLTEEDLKAYGISQTSQAMLDDKNDKIELTKITRNSRSKLKNVSHVNRKDKRRSKVKKFSKIEIIKEKLKHGKELKTVTKRHKIIYAFHTWKGNNKKITYTELLAYMQKLYPSEKNDFQRPEQVYNSMRSIFESFDAQTEDTDIKYITKSNSKYSIFTIHQGFEKLSFSEIETVFQRGRKLYLDNKGKKKDTTSKPKIEEKIVPLVDYYLGAFYEMCQNPKGFDSVFIDRSQNLRFTQLSLVSYLLEKNPELEKMLDDDIKDHKHFYEHLFMIDSLQIAKSDKEHMGYPVYIVFKRMVEQVQSCKNFLEFIRKLHSNKFTETLIETVEEEPIEPESTNTEKAEADTAPKDIKQTIEIPAPAQNQTIELNFKVGNVDFGIKITNTN